MPLEITLPETEKAQGGKGYVLVVDDELDIREGLELLLTSEGYSVDLAQNGARASTRWRRRATTWCCST